MAARGNEIPEVEIDDCWKKTCEFWLCAETGRWERLPQTPNVHTVHTVHHGHEGYRDRRCTVIGVEQVIESRALMALQGCLVPQAYLMAANIDAKRQGPPLCRHDSCHVP